jgi:branched-subunit amino acid aminotransferase/4-amino-4-deoxychorismate lyase
MTEYCYLNGEIIPTLEAKVSVLDIGLLRGYGIYDGLGTIKGKVFHFERHWDRFLEGAHFLNLNVPVTPQTVEKKIQELVEKNGFNTMSSGRANVRMILTGGNTISGIEYDFQKPTFYIVTEKFTPLSEKFYKEGSKLSTFEYMREFPKYKTINYTRAVSLQDFRKEEGALEILYTKDGEVYECATSNIFLVKDGKIITPAEDVLFGITRKVVLEIADGKYEVEERRVYTNELKEADEIFITSSFKDVVPVVEIDDFKIGDGVVGPVSKNIMQLYGDALAG